MREVEAIAGDRLGSTAFEDFLDAEDPPVRRFRATFRRNVLPTKAQARTDMGLTGLEVLGILRRIYRAIPVMFVTASGSERIMAQARRLGASEIFAAPVDIEVLKGAIRAAMRR